MNGADVTRCTMLPSVANAFLPHLRAGASPSREIRGLSDGHADGVDGVACEGKGRRKKLRVEVERRQPQTLGADGGSSIALRQRP